MRETLRLEDPRAVHAVAHPVRLELLSIMRRRGPATASLLARALGESSGSTSYHLRQLAKHGLIEELPDRGNRRERWWQLRARNFRFSDAAEASPTYRRAMHVFRGAMSAREAALWAEFVEDEPELPKVWREASLFQTRNVYLTARELREVGARFDELLRPYWRDDPATRGRGSRSVYVSLRAFPMREPRRDD
jgi:DNA-binding transcriptional ArsR family regulator